MSSRLDYATVSPEGYRAMIALYRYLPACGLEPGLIHLVFLRVSQINGCAYCVDLHWHDALKAGDSARRLNSVVTWRETPFFSPRERAALAWAEALTRIAETHAPDADYDAVRAVFTDKELVDLSFAIGMMNGLNRIGIGFRRTPAAESVAA
jgi:AhpD family alkylhydroperoxidase